MALAQSITLALKRSRGERIVGKTDWQLVSEAAYGGAEECPTCPYFKGECTLGDLDRHRAWECDALQRMRESQ